MIGMFFIFAVSSYANWKEPHQKSGMSLEKTQTTQQTKSDTLPEGVTQDWLDQITDENGNRIMSGSSSRAPDEDPEEDAFQTRNFTGLNTDDRLGFSVSSAGDVNGDGYDDIIMGAPYNDGAASGAGRAYIFYGGININNIVDVTLSGETVNNIFGISVSGAGDVNGDGYADVIVGAYGYSSNTGRAYIFYGGTVMNNISDVTMTGETAGNYFGYSVSIAGDVNGDGYSDVIVGAYGYSSNTGRAYIFYGGASMNNTADVTMTGEATFNYFGRSVSTSGDVNGDGYSDVIVGAIGYSSNIGRAYIFYGGTVMNNISDVTMTGETAGNYFGYSVSIAGDANGDGYSDVIVGADGYSSNTGRAYIFYGGASMNNTADLTMTGEATFNYFGRSVSTSGDVNGDGYSDVIVGASGYSNATGRAYIFYGGISMNNTADVPMTGETTTNWFGHSVSEAGDVNGDGYSDVIVGAYGYNSSTGRAYLYMYGMNGTFLSDLSMTGEATYNYFGTVSSAGDVNGDGFSDVIVGAPRYNGVTGRAYIFYGGVSMNNIADITMTGEAISSNFGFSVSEAGDVNGDGYSDVIVGAEQYNSNTGRAYIFYGGSSMNNTADVIITGEGTNNHFGNSVSEAGDVNGDGYSDVIVGAYGYNSNTGRAYIVYGGTSMNNIADVIMTGEATNNVFGGSVSGAGDVNGDGYSDVIIGAGNYSFQTGRTYVYYGGASMNNTADVTMTGESTNYYFGGSVSGSGDINGDGYSDVIVGAQASSKAFIFYGGASMNNIADVTMAGEAISDRFGLSVSAAGDVNGDGYSDVIVGADIYSIQTGRAYVFYGGASMNNIADVTMTGEATYDNFGISVSTAGDVNGDGNPDLIIGAAFNNSYTGKSYVYFTSSPNVHPNLLSVKDVPNDQGGYVKLKWSKSGLDVPVHGTVTQYIVERSIPPGATGYQWEQIGTVLPTQSNTYYYYTAPTPTDSGIIGNTTFFFRVTAYTDVALQLYRSNILSGYSVDNLAPLPPANLAGALVGNAAQLNWDQNSESDLRQYIIYRNGVQIGTSTTLDFTDNTIVSGSTYTYTIAAEDIHGNISGQSNPVIITYSVSTINIKVIPEGFYDASTNRLNRKDTVRAYLHNNISPFSVVDSSIAVIDSITFQGVFKFFNAPNGTYYIVIKHRNTIETWSKSGGEPFVIGTMMSYDFTNANTKAFGNNMKQVDLSPVQFAIFSGDVNQDGTVDLTDASLIDNDANSFVSGYVNTDVNGDNLVDLADGVIADNNASNFVSVIRP